MKTRTVFWTEPNLKIMSLRLEENDGKYQVTECLGFVGMVESVKVDLPFKVLYKNDRSVKAQIVALAKDARIYAKGINILNVISISNGQQK